MSRAVASRYPRWPLYRQVLSLELRKTFSYRFDFWFRFLGVLMANVVIAYYLWSAIFAQTGAAQIGGYTFQGMILYYLMVPLIENVSRGQESGLAQEIYGGTLTRYLVYPVPFFPFRYVGSLAGTVVALLQLVVVLGGYLALAGRPSDLPLTAGTVAMGLVAAVAAGLLNFLMVAALEMVAFWADQIWSLNVMLMFCVRLLGGSLLPLSLFPDWSRAALAWTPFPYLVSFPIRTLTGQVALVEWGQGLLIIALWSLGFALLDRWIWRRGNLRYTGVGQ